MCDHDALWIFLWQRTDLDVGVLDRTRNFGPSDFVIRNFVSLRSNVRCEVVTPAVSADILSASAFRPERSRQTRCLRSQRSDLIYPFVDTLECLLELSKN
jgi:hypothetical protein